MIDFIQNETKKIMYKCCERYSQRAGVGIDDVQLVLGINEEGNTYTMCENYVPKESYDIMQVLGVRIDFLGYRNIAPPFIIKSLLRYMEQYNITSDRIKILCVPTKDDKGKNDVALFVYNGNDYVETITFSELFREEDIEMPKLE
jgi:hypothetical protein